MFHLILIQYLSSDRATKTLGIIFELFYFEQPKGKLLDPNGQFTEAVSWYHATMYFFFGLSGVADVISHTAKHILPGGTYLVFKLLISPS